jgi:phosphoribosylaminoimidazolecarboxamide formyltransferase/IMP cyclohydrolase
VSDKTGVIEFARGLAALGCELVSTGGTAQALASAGLRVVPVSTVTGVPEMLDGRVKTLHPKIHGGILARRRLSGDMAALASHGITPIDVVAVNLYPFEQTSRKAGVSLDELIEDIDIGGPSMVRAAAKNFRDVLVVVHPEDYPRILDELRRTSGPTLVFRYELMGKAFRHTAAYDHAIQQTLMEYEARADGTFACRSVATSAPEHVLLQLRKDRDLRYGENPHQPAALFNAAFRMLQGKELSYTNLLDLDAAERVAAEFREPAAVVIKHANPCGAATGSNTREAYVRARDADVTSAFGGIVGLNRPLDRAVAEVIVETFIEAVTAPSVEEAAREILQSRPKMRVVTPDRPPETVEFRSILRGMLMQTPDRVVEAHEPWPSREFPRVVTTRQPTAEEWQALRFGWRVCAHVKSNAVIFTSADRTLAIGAGQMSRVDAVKVAVMKGGAALKGSVAASDAFFPFRDGLDALADAGASAVVQPGGSVRDAEVIEAADERGIAMVFTGIRHFRH